MKRAVNDSTLSKAGDMFQYLIALRDCFELNDDDTLLIEVHGDVSVINSEKGLFQKEVKHHFNKTTLSSRSIDFWKTVANWYQDYDQVKNFSHYILCTTAKIAKSSPFYNWNDIDKNEKLARLKAIGEKTNSREEKFRFQYNRIFSKTYDENRLLDILNKFTIESSKTSIDGISKEFAKFVGHIPVENRDNYIGALLGDILIKIKDPPHKWSVNRKDFEELLQYQSAAYVKENTAPLPTNFRKAIVPTDKIAMLEQKKFVSAIREIKFDKMIDKAISDYWKANLTIAKFFQNNLMYLDSLESYMDDLKDRMEYAKEEKMLDAEKKDEQEKIILSKKLYTGVMKWEAADFGSIIRNVDYFQRGIIHNIVNDTDFKWKIGEQNECKEN